jgi:hypothetical protein
MKDFESIDWDQYNRPPFYQQWLCEGDPHKLATFGDQNLTDIVSHVLKLKDQWDLETVNGVLLDRIGKVLQEARNGNSDELYRLYLRLRTMLNTANGNVNHVIKVIKSLYSSEVVHIVPDYPAGIIILHDGEGPDINFNDIIKQVVGAGINYSTKELFYFDEELELDERASAIRAKAGMEDYLGYVFRNGVVRRNGTYRRSYTGVKDQLTIIAKIAAQERMYGRTLHNGLFRRDGTLTHNGFIPTQDPAMERLAFTLHTNQAEQVAAAEQTTLALFETINEVVERDCRHNGTFRRNGTIQHTNRVYDKIDITAKVASQERMYGALRRNGVVQRNGSEQRSGFTRYLHPATEKLVTTVRNSYAESVSASEPFLAVTIAMNTPEDFHKRIRRNGFTKRNGYYNRASGISEGHNIKGEVTGFSDSLGECRETFAIGYRKHRFHNGTYSRNGQIKHDAYVLIPLE